MKKNIFITIASVAIMLFASSCYQVRTYSTGLSNDAVLEFVGNPSNYKGGVDVTIDDVTKFKAEVKKDNAESPKGYVYSISKGTHVVNVSYNGVALFNKKLFVSPQETKKIELPWENFY